MFLKNDQATREHFSANNAEKEVTSHELRPELKTDKVRSTHGEL